jgi:hypothetical protein
MHNTPSDSHSFVVRIWNDAGDTNSPSAASPASWRGSIDHVGTGKRAHFNDLEHLIRFIQDSSGVQLQVPPPSGSDQQSST